MPNSDAIIRHGVVPVSTVPPSGAEYVIPGMVQLGAINLFQGEPGCGKTSLLLALAASIAGGRPIPGLPALVHGPVLILSEEDNAGQVRIALEANGADLDMCHIVTKPAGLSISSAALAEIIANIRPVLTIMDPIQAYLGNININQADQLRPALAQLCSVARQHNCAVVMITHTGKNRADKSRIYQSLGSIDLPAAARCIVACTPKEDNSGFVLSPVKCSSGPLAPSIEYTIGTDRVVNWGSILGVTPDPLDRDPLYHTLVQLAENSECSVFSYADLEAAAHSLTGRTLGGWELIQLKLSGAVGQRLASRSIKVSMSQHGDNKYVIINTSYIIPGVVD